MCTFFCTPYAYDEDSNEKDDATLAPLAPLAIRTPVVKLDDDTAKFIFTTESSFDGGGVFVLLMRFVLCFRYGSFVVFVELPPPTVDEFSSGFFETFRV